MTVNQTIKHSGKIQSNTTLLIFFYSDMLRHLEAFFMLNIEEYIYIYTHNMGWRSWLRHCATSRKVAGSIPDDVIGIFH